MILHWYSGWASHLGEMPLALPTELAKHKNVFYSFEELMHKQDRPQPDVLFAWSMGVHFIPPHYQGTVFLLNPALEFCHSTLGWKPKVLERMSKQLRRNPTDVFENFSQQLSTNEAIRRRWIECAQKMDIELLCQGLAQLSQPVTLNFTQFERTLCLQGEDDLLCSLELNQTLCQKRNLPLHTLPQVGHEIFSPLWMQEIKTLL